MKHVIIERSDLQSPFQRATGSVITFVFWLFWVYLWVPLLTFLAWLVGINLFQENILENEAYKVLFVHVGWYIAVILLIAVLLIGWARYNLFRFRGKGLRKKPLPIDAATHARDFKIDVERLIQWQAEKHLIIFHDKNGHITKIEMMKSGLQTDPE